mmetsp:Transcript_16201/g.41928  ORF Transcript_16201/g.41928 Transcript_16201/m.41928 type:complete len:299 (+) Transcript_16201:647-1543(+)
MDDRPVTLNGDARVCEREGGHLPHQPLVREHLDAQHRAYAERWQRAHDHPEEGHPERVVRAQQRQVEAGALDGEGDHHGRHAAQAHREHEGGQPQRLQRDPRGPELTRGDGQLEDAPEPLEVVLAPQHEQRARTPHRVLEVLHAQLLERRVALVDAQPVEEAGRPERDARLTRHAIPEEQHQRVRHARPGDQLEEGLGRLEPCLRRHVPRERRKRGEGEEGVCDDECSRVVICVHQREVLKTPRRAPAVTDERVAPIWWRRRRASIQRSRLTQRGVHAKGGDAALGERTSEPRFVHRS